MLRHVGRQVRDSGPAVSEAGGDRMLRPLPARSDQGRPAEGESYSPARVRRALGLSCALMYTCAHARTLARVHAHTTPVRCRLRGVGLQAALGDRSFGRRADEALPGGVLRAAHELRRGSRRGNLCAFACARAPLSVSMPPSPSYHLSLASRLPSPPPPPRAPQATSSRLPSSPPPPRVPRATLSRRTATRTLWWRTGGRSLSCRACILWSRSTTRSGTSA